MIRRGKDGGILLLKDLSSFVGGFVLRCLNPKCFGNGLAQVCIHSAHPTISVDLSIAFVASHISKELVQLALVLHKGLIDVVGDVEISPKLPMVHGVILVE